jgi:hypothetical protein
MAAKLDARRLAKIVRAFSHVRRESQVLGGAGIAAATREDRA